MSYLAIDIGASSGRHIIGDIKDNKLVLKEIYRFSNGPTKREDGHLIWDHNHLFNEIINGLKEAKKQNIDVQYIAIDTWAVDYALLDNEDKLIGEIYCYRDKRGKEASLKVHNIIKFEEIYKKTGIQYQPFNTIYQLYDDVLTSKIKKAKTMLMLPDYLNFLLTGIKKQEYTNATSTGLVNHLTHTWDEELLHKLGIDKSLLLPITQPGNIVGQVKPEIKELIGYDATVLLPATHDTASAIIAAPINVGDPYISSGTWSLLGVEEDVCHTDKKSMEFNYSNEGDVNYLFRYQKNIMGLWIIQQVRHELNDKYSFPELVDLALKNVHDKVINVNDECFISPNSMIEEIKKKIGEASVGEIAYCVYHSLAISYRESLKELERLTNHKLTTLNIVGGGCANELLNQMTADECGIKVCAGPKEATAIGNLLMQLIATKVVKDVNEGRELVKRSFPVNEINSHLGGTTMKDIMTAPFLVEFCKTTSNMYRLGWDERNGGNISYILKEEEVKEYLDLDHVIRTIDFMGVESADFDASPLIGKIFLVTGTGKYFKNIESDPRNNLGIVRIAKDGKHAELLWGFEDGGRFTSEFPAHIMSHMARLEVDPENRVVMHCHPTNILAMTYVHELDEAKFSHTLWQMSTECVVVFPEGVGVLPWMLCGTKEIGEATAKKFHDFRAVLWSLHGIYGAGKSLDEAFGLVETIEKSATIYNIIGSRPILNTISDEAMEQLIHLFKIEDVVRWDFLNKK